MLQATAKISRQMKPIITPAGLRVIAGMGCFAASLVIGRCELVDFTKDIRPIFEQHCLKCHGPEKQKGGLRFDTKEGAFKPGESGERSIVPGRSSQSRLIKLVCSKDPDERMPSKGDPLTASAIDLLKRWIDAG